MRTVGWPWLARATAFVVLIALATGACAERRSEVRTESAGPPTAAELPEEKIARVTSGWFNYGDDDMDYPLVVVTNTIWLWLVGIYGECGGRFEIGHVVPIGESPHMYEPSDADRQMLEVADFVVTSGIGAIPSLDPILVDLAGEGTPVFRFSEHIADPIVASGSDGVAITDPHVWLDPVRMAAALDTLTLELADAIGDRDNAQFAECRENTALWFPGDDDMIRQEVDSIPPDDRVLLTTSDAFAYFADRYGFAVIPIDRRLLTAAESIIGAVQPEHHTRLNAYLAAAGQPVIFTDELLTDDIDEALQRIAEADGARVTSLPLEGLELENLGFPTDETTDDQPQLEISSLNGYSDLLYEMSDLIRADLTGTESVTRRWAEDN